jgi:hypothetical protein
VDVGVDVAGVPKEKGFGAAVPVGAVELAPAPPKRLPVLVPPKMLPPVLVAPCAGWLPKREVDWAGAAVPAV